MVGLGGLGWGFWGVWGCHFDSRFFFSSLLYFRFFQHSPWASQIIRQTAEKFSENFSDFARYSRLPLQSFRRQTAKILRKFLRKFLRPPGKFRRHFVFGTTIWRKAKQRKEPQKPRNLSAREMRRRSRQNFALRGVLGTFLNLREQEYGWREREN